MPDPRLMFLSYPKSGRTWIRFMVDAYLADLHGIPVRNVFRVERRVDPRWRIEWTHLTGALVHRLPAYQVADVDLERVDGRRCVFLRRDPHATLASAWFHARYRIDVFDGPPSEFIRSPLFGAPKLAAFYEMVDGLRRRFASFTELSYEAVVAEPKSGVLTVLDALGAEVDVDRLERAVALGGFESMRALARTPEYAGSVIAPADPGNPGSDKVRRGGDGDWGSLFSGEDVAYIDSVLPG